MKHMTKLALLLSALVAFGCKNDDNEDTTTGNLLPDVDGALGKANRPDTDDGSRIDRAGRPAISAALISTFDPAAREADLDAYNKSGNYNLDFLQTVETSLAILDGLNRVCGDQLMNGPGANRYRPLATTLLDDQVYVQSNREGAGSAYLGVEAEALGAVDPGQGSGGGRVPGDDVVERSYSVLVQGTLGNVDDGVEADDAEHDIDTFPFLAAPQ